MVRETILVQGSRIADRRIRNLARKPTVLDRLFDSWTSRSRLVCVADEEAGIPTIRASRCEPMLTGGKDQGTPNFARVPVSKDSRYDDLFRRRFGLRNPGSVVATTTHVARSGTRS